MTRLTRKISDFRRADGTFPPLAGADPVADTNKKLRDELKRVQARKSDLRDQRAGVVKERDSAREAFAAGDMKTDSAEFKLASNTVKKVGEIDDQLAQAQAEEVGLLELLGGADSGSTAGPAAPPSPSGPAWSSSELLADDEARHKLSQMAGTSLPFGRLALGEIADRDALAGMLAADVPGTTNMRRGAFYGVVPQLRRQLRLLDLIPTGTMDQNTIPYTQESGSFATAAETAEGGLKPEAAVTFTDQTATAVTIAHWTKTRKQVLADTPALQTILDGRLRYGVERRLQDQIIAGDGAGENMRGILNTSGIVAVPFDADELVADQVLRGITSVFLADAEANAIVLHPNDWRDALMAKALGDGHYYSSGPFAVTPQVMWGVPLIPSSAIPQGMALVGDFAVGVQLFIREGVMALISDADQDDFIHNRVTLLAEMRAALAVWQPAVFATVDLAA